MCAKHEYIQLNFNVIHITWLTLYNNLMLNVIATLIMNQIPGNTMVFQMRKVLREVTHGNCLKLSHSWHDSHASNIPCMCFMTPCSAHQFGEHSLTLWFETDVLTLTTIPGHPEHNSCMQSSTGLAYLLWIYRCENCVLLITQRFVLHPTISL